MEEVRWTEKRYGVLSEVLVRDRTTQSVQRVVNQSVLDRGGMCRRVLTMPGKSSYQAMRYSGRFQLEQSAAERLRLELTLAGRVAAWPGDLVELNLARYSLSGVWRVLSTEHGETDRDSAPPWSWASGRSQFERGGGPCGFLSGREADSTARPWWDRPP